jgi:exonuclease III
MVLNRQDKTNPCGQLIPQYERIIFNQLLEHLGLEDHPRSIGSSKYSWDNLREDGVRVLARLDCAYIFRNDQAQGCRKHAIRADSGWSDHSPIELELELGEGQE